MAFGFWGPEVKWPKKVNFIGLYVWFFYAVSALLTVLKYEGELKVWPYFCSLRDTMC